MKIELGKVENKRQFISDYLEKIGWYLRHHGCDHYYFYNHNDECTDMFLLFSETDGRICFEMRDKSGASYKMPSFTFYLKDTSIDLLDNDCVSFSGNRDESIFILCQNFDRKKKKVKRLSPKEKDI